MGRAALLTLGDATLNLMDDEDDPTDEIARIEARLEELAEVALVDRKSVV